MIEYKTAYHWNYKTVSADIQHQVITIAKYWLKRDYNVLDIGCGDGYITDCISRYCRAVVGVDVSESGLRFAQQLADRRINWVLGDACRLPFQSSTFDAVVSVETIEHLNAEQLDRAIKEMSRVLKPEGIILVTTPNRERFLEKRSDKHFREYSAGDLRELFSSHFCELGMKGIFLQVPLLGWFKPTRMLLLLLGLYVPKFSQKLFYSGEKL